MARSDTSYPRRKKEYLKFRTKEQRARTETEWEEWLIRKLQKLGWKFRKDFQKEGKTKIYLLEKNLLIQLQNFYRRKHNKPYFKFSEDETNDLLEELKKTNYRDPNESIVIDSFLRKKERLEIPLIDKENIQNNQFEVIQQVHEYHKGKFSHIYDLVLLINGLPLVCIELKKATISISEAFSQLKRYWKDRLVSEPASILNNFQLFISTNFQRVDYFWRRDILDLMHLERLTLRWCNHDSFQQLKWVNLLFSPSKIIEQLFKRDTRFSAKLRRNVWRQKVATQKMIREKYIPTYPPTIKTKKFIKKKWIIAWIFILGFFILINCLSGWKWWTILIGLLISIVAFWKMWSNYKLSSSK